MTYASLWSFSYFTFTLNHLLTPDTREYVYTKIWALHRYSFLKQVCRLWNLPCVIIALQLAQNYLMSAIKPCTYSLLERVLVPPWLAGHVQPCGGGGFTEKMQKKTLKVNHGWPWFGKAFLNHSQPWLTMVWQSFSKPWSTMVNHRFVKWHLSQPW